MDLYYEELNLDGCIEFTRGDSLIGINLDSREVPCIGPRVLGLFPPLIVKLNTSFIRVCHRALRDSSYLIDLTINKLAPSTKNVRINRRLVSICLAHTLLRSLTISHSYTNNKRVAFMTKLPSGLISQDLSYTHIFRLTIGRRIIISYTSVCRKLKETRLTESIVSAEVYLACINKPKHKPKSLRQYEVVYSGETYIGFVSLATNGIYNDILALTRHGIQDVTNKMKYKIDKR